MSKWTLQNKFSKTTEWTLNTIFIKSIWPHNTRFSQVGQLISDQYHRLVSISAECDDWRSVDCDVASGWRWTSIRTFTIEPEQTQSSACPV